MADGGAGGIGKHAETRMVLRCVEWLVKQPGVPEARWYEELDQQAQTARSPRDRRHAIELLTKLSDLVPKPDSDESGPVTINVAIVSTGRAGLPAQGNGVAVRIGRGNGHGT